MLKPNHKKKKKEWKADPVGGVSTGYNSLFSKWYCILVFVRFLFPADAILNTCLDFTSLVLLRYEMRSIVGRVRMIRNIQKMELEKRKQEAAKTRSKHLC